MRPKSGCGATAGDSLKIDHGLSLIGQGGSMGGASCFRVPDVAVLGGVLCKYGEACWREARRSLPLHAQRDNAAVTMRARAEPMVSGSGEAWDSRRSVQNGARSSVFIRSCSVTVTAGVIRTPQSSPIHRANYVREGDHTQQLVAVLRVAGVCR
jgi:hypothetical protein